nr:HAD family phosphatase [Elstera litoralis]
MPFDAVIFDMDGLLLDSERMFRIVWQLAATDLGVEMNDEVFLSLIGLNRRSAEERLKSVYGPSWDHEALYGRIEHHWQGIGGHDAIPLKTGVGELLDHLDAAALPRAVATSTARKAAEQKLTKVGLLPRFHGLVGGDEVAAGKPAPDPLPESRRTAEGRSQPLPCPGRQPQRSACRPRRRDDRHHGPGPHRPHRRLARRGPSRHGRSP